MFYLSTNYHIINFHKKLNSHVEIRKNSIKKTKLWINIQKSQHRIPYSLKFKSQSESSMGEKKIRPFQLCKKSNLKSDGQKK